ncbi:MAG TPA: hypothetical protein ENN99_12760, partial [Chloroflexi bacterium]|nr:hypothetical protein [Chloroflexota bacterium]
MSHETRNAYNGLGSLIALALIAGFTASRTVQASVIPGTSRTDKAASRRDVSAAAHTLGIPTPSLIPTPSSTPWPTSTPTHTPTPAPTPTSTLTPT